MGERQQVHQELGGKTARPRSRVDEPAASAESLAAGVGVKGLNRLRGLPTESASAAVRRAVLLGLQRQQGNAFVQRLLSDAPALGLPLHREGEPGEEPEPIEPLANVDGVGEEHEAVAFSGESIVLHGQAEATYNGGSFRTADVTTARGEGCSGCGRGNPCVHATGTLITDYGVETAITLPAVPSGLTPCQTEKAQAFIDNELATSVLMSGRWNSTAAQRPAPSTSPSVGAGLRVRSATWLLPRKCRVGPPPRATAMPSTRSTAALIWTAKSRSRNPKANSIEYRDGLSGGSSGQRRVNQVCERLLRDFVRCVCSSPSYRSDGEPDNAGDGRRPQQLSLGRVPPASAGMPPGKRAFELIEVGRVDAAQSKGHNAPRLHRHRPLHPGLFLAPVEPTSARPVGDAPNGP